ncbi:peptide deformylase [Candidatus Cyrtobacter comes]|uniref:peptide deformylase n=1 Tax=Candidatus Cyrtobacter comes TaxID=675776 RepID=UPI002ACD54DC|nr:peptide deformylase [Candidatus Cyrtobacter comes]
MFDYLKPNLLELVTDPSPLLLKKSSEISKIDKETEQLISDMFFTMRKNNGVGLAAVQVGVLKRVIVMDIPNLEDMPHYFLKPCVMINASIRSYGKDFMSFDEGCLSFPGLSIHTHRPRKIVVDFLDHEGKKHREKIHGGILSICIQHEIDHTNGIIFTTKGDIVQE